MEIFEGMESGRVKAIWIVCNNPLVSLPDGIRRLNLLVENVHCANCIRKIEDALHAFPGVQRARVNYRNAELDLEGMRQQVALQVRQAYLDYQANQKQLDVAEKQVIAAAQALEAERERYNVGAATLVELSQAQANYVLAASNQAQAKYDFLFQGKLIEYYVGRLDPSQPLLP